MSGGHFNYMYESVRYTYVGHMEDDFLNVFMNDLCDLLHDLEWYKSYDTGEDTYRTQLKDFKAKWFDDNSEVKANIIQDIKDEAIRRIEAV